MSSELDAFMGLEGLGGRGGRGVLNNGASCAPDIVEKREVHCDDSLGKEG